MSTDIPLPEHENTIKNGRETWLLVSLATHNIESSTITFYPLAQNGPINKMLNYKITS